MKSDFKSAFARLRGILKPHAARLEVVADAPDHYCLAISHSPKLKKGFPVAWVKISKAYVSFHFMPIYIFPKLRERMSENLRARMQGKSCFNFTTPDETLFAELEQLTAEGLAMCRKLGFAPEK